MERVICLLIGYAFGLIQTGYLYGRTKHIDIRTKGSGNAGTTNALRTMGVKAGVVTLLGDCLKCVFAVLAVRLIFGGAHGDILPVLSQYAGLGAILGHNYPFYMKFKGGKGIAVTAGIIITTWNIWIMLICLAVFLIAVAATKYVSVGSLTVVLTYFICVVVYGQMGGFHVDGSHLYEMYILAALVVVSAFYKHAANIKRLMNGTENKLSVGKSK
ncbi:glycerol-3-phosphate 1-O-acyltransferase PlsY [Mordavella massiliensis]|uniref:Glycerol-3-phosphate acyltransferase n=1 Tax=Mordavella massiliensis TaxID=1871024 RepID=A0A938X8V0_9CLOT|nr:glycerol-3-phosphate 1-O-acyltransferase PlsY [Mordavella massiliensis]MBM6947610.1 glycerol-3-phosphate 1-O-acyltransferase PlsY [Mordavella massiliensis]